MNNKKEKIKKRQDELKNKIVELKLTYSRTICDKYIKYGKPPIETIIKSLSKEQRWSNENLCELLDELKTRNIEYSEDVPSYKKYIKKGGNINETLEKGEIEKVLMQKTKYLSIMENMDSETARELSTIDFCDSGQNSPIIDDYLKKKGTIKFD